MRERAVVIELNDLSHEEAEEPLEITVTEAGGITARLYALLRKVVTVIENPASVPASYRQSVADTIRMELEGLEEDGSDPESWFDTEG